jgi:hypothetical protein
MRNSDTGATQAFLARIWHRVYDKCVLYNILTEFGIPTEIVRLTEMCRKVNYSIIRVGKPLPVIYPIESGLKQGDALSSLLFKFV